MPTPPYYSSPQGVFPGAIPSPDPYYPLGKIWHATREALSLIRDHGETPADAFNILMHEGKLSPHEGDEVWERVLVELEIEDTY